MQTGTHVKYVDDDAIKSESKENVFSEVRKLGGLDQFSSIDNSVDHSGKSFAGKDLRGHAYFQCRLNDADFSEATGLLPTSFAQSDLTNARLPDYLSFDPALDSIAGAAKQAKTIFFIILSACLYCLLTAAKTTHLALMDNSLLVEMPIIKEKVSLAPFYLVAPVVLLIPFLWMNSYMQRVWALIATLPSRFPDGVPLNTKMTQWLPLSVRLNKQGGRQGTRSPGRFRFLEFVLSFIGLWAVLPLTFLVMLFAYFPRHDLAVSAVALAVLVFVIAASVHFARCARWTFADPFGETPARRSVRRTGIASFLIYLCLLAPLAIVLNWGYPFNWSYSNGWNKPLVSYVFMDGLAESTGLKFDLALPTGAQLIKKPEGWNPALTGRTLTELLDDLPQVDLSDRNFDRAKFSEMFLPKVLFNGAKMRNVNAASADLAGTSFIKADLRWANFEQADLRDANFRNADLRGADFSGANLRGACLEKAFIADTKFHGADLSDARISWPPTEATPIAQFSRAFCSKNTRFPIKPDLFCMLDDRGKFQKSGKSAGQERPKNNCGDQTR